MKIRTMSIEDYPDLYQLWLSCKGMGLNHLDDSEEGIRRFIERNPETCLVALDQGRLIGAILVGNDGRRAYIYHTAVHPVCRRRGVGKALVSEALTVVEALGLHKVSLVVFERNETGNGFWEELGFGVREDLVYRDKALSQLVRIDT